jgi:hypothetical protein
MFFFWLTQSNAFDSWLTGFDHMSLKSKILQVPSKERIAFSAQLECNMDAFLSPPKLMEILHVTSALGGDRSKIIKSI